MLFKQNQNAGYANLHNKKEEQLINGCKLQLNKSVYTEFSRNTIYSTCSEEIWSNLFVILEGGGTMYQGEIQTPILPGHLYLHPAGNSNIKRIYKKGCRKLHLSFRITLFEYTDIFHSLKDPICMEDVNHVAAPMTKAILSHKAHTNLSLIPLLFLALEPVFEQLSGELDKLLIRGQKYEPVFQYINSHLSAQLRIEEIAKNVGMSVSQLTHSLPIETGFTIKAYLQQELLQKAISDLTTTDLLLKTIAEKYGFSTAEYFSGWFRNQMGVSPRKYRKDENKFLKSGSLYD